MSGPLYAVFKEFARDSFGADLDTLRDHGASAQVRHHAGGNKFYDALSWLRNNKKDTFTIFFTSVYSFLILFSLVGIFVRNTNKSFTGVVQVLMYIMLFLLLGFGLYSGFNTKKFGNSMNASTIAIYAIVTGMGYAFVFQTARMMGANCKNALLNAKVTCNKKLCAAGNKKTCLLPTEMPVAARIRNGLGYTVGILFILSIGVAIVPMLFLVWDKVSLNGTQAAPFFLLMTFCAFIVTILDIVMFVFGVVHNSSSGSTFFLLVKDFLVVMALTMWAKGNVSAMSAAVLNAAKGKLGLMSSPVTKFSSQMLKSFVSSSAPLKPFMKDIQDFMTTMQKAAKV